MGYRAATYLLLAAAVSVTACGSTTIEAATPAIAEDARAGTDMAALVVRNESHRSRICNVHLGMRVPRGDQRRSCEFHRRTRGRGLGTGEFRMFRVCPGTYSVLLENCAGRLVHQEHHLAVANPGVVLTFR